MTDTGSDPGTDAAPPPPATVRRFTQTEIVFHWAQAVPYLVLLLTGGLLFFERILGAQVVAPEVLIDVHRIAGIALPVCILLTVLGGDRKILLRNLRLGTHFSKADLRWLRDMPRQRFRPDIELPPMGKFNAGQKINFTVQVIVIPVFFVTGLVMWFAHGVLLPWYVHVIAFAVVTPLVLGHLYLALINPATRRSLTSVTHGRVNRAWAEHHHPLEYGHPLEHGPARPSAETASDEPDREHAT